MQSLAKVGLLALLLGTLGVVGGCSSAPADDSPKVEGKVDIKEAPPGTTAPGEGTKGADKSKDEGG
ncbi:MAG: hypothetical protein JST40_07525 [Armatimonadetes bacterium]|nr:hypothetical protein [Armatimonadota bacterium]